MTTAAATLGRNGPGTQFVALGLQHDRQFGQAEARAAVLLGDRQAGPAQVGGRRPDLGRMGGPVVEGRAGGGPAVQPVELAERRVGEVVCVLR